jgi:hypothetical protein
VFVVFDEDWCEKILRLEQQIDILDDELSLAIESYERDPKNSLNKVRIGLEKILKDMFEREMGEVPKKLKTIGDFLGVPQFTQGIEVKILIRMHSAREWGNLGSHGSTNGSSLTVKDVFSVLDSLAEILEWYMVRYNLGGHNSSHAILKKKEIAAKNVSQTVNNINTIVNSGGLTNLGIIEISKKTVVVKNQSSNNQRPKT